jgi:hypothetical protein
VIIVDLMLIDIVFECSWYIKKHAEAPAALLFNVKPGPAAKLTQMASGGYLVSG